MVSSVMRRESVPGLEHLGTDHADMGHVQVHLCVSLHLVLVILQATQRAPPLAHPSPFYHRLQNSIQI